MVIPLYPPASLAVFAGTVVEEQSGLPFASADYLDLVDWTGKAVRSDKRGAIPEGVPPILKRLGVKTENWIDTVRHLKALNKLVDLFEQRRFVQVLEGLRSHHCHQVFADNLPTEPQ